MGKRFVFHISTFQEFHEICFWEIKTLKDILLFYKIGCYFRKDLAPLWFSNVQNIFFSTEYILNNETDYQFLRSRKRQYKKDSIFKKYLTGNQNEYDVYEKDIALVHIYFDSSSIIEYQRQVTMTW